LWSRIRRLTGGKGGGETNVDRSEDTSGAGDDFDALFEFLVLGDAEAQVIWRGGDAQASGGGFLGEFDVGKLLVRCDGCAGLGSEDRTTDERAGS
jgi:hypothetical protein